MKAEFLGGMLNLLLNRKGSPTASSLDANPHQPKGRLRSLQPWFKLCTSLGVVRLGQADPAIDTPGLPASIPPPLVYLPDYRNGCRLRLRSLCERGVLALSPVLTAIAKLRPS
jgi:hypothetical protein